MFRRHSRLFHLGLALVFAFFLISCVSGGNSSDTAEVFAVSVTDKHGTATMEVSFSLSDNGTPLTGVASSSIRFTVAKLVFAGGHSAWQSYINTLETKSAGAPGTNPDGATAIQATSELANTTGGIFTDNGDGTYSYKFSFNFKAVTSPVDVAWEPNLTHRIAMQVSGNATNAVYDFIPANQNAIPATRNIVDNTACSQCHERLGLHGGDRVAIKYCVTCHNPGSEDANSGNTVDFKIMVHKIHRGASLPEVQAGGSYIIWGFRNTAHDYSAVVFPQDILNCTKCHDNTNAATPDADNWKNRPSLETCLSCHDAPDAAQYPTFPNLTAAQIETAHLTANATPHNPNLPAGVPNIQYLLYTVTVDAANTAFIDFQILRDGVPLDLLNLPADLTAASNRPSFILAYAQGQDGIATPAEYNNLGRSSAQPRSVSLSSVNSLVLKGDGTFTATIANAFPAGATLRAVGLQGYFQVDVDGDGSADYPLHTPSAVMSVTGDAGRREVVDNSKCAQCHEWFEGHGGNRVYNMNICVFCHNPNLSSSGREIASPDTRVSSILGTNALTYPEATNNFKDMIHGIHGSAVRTYDYEFVRNRQNGYYYNFSEVIFPARAGNCLICHKPGTYSVPLVDNTLMTTDRTTGVADGQDATVAAVSAAQDSVPNATDFVITSTAAACYACHDSDLDKAHMLHNGGYVNSNRSSVVAASPVETCSLCHGSGQVADVEAKHAGTDYTLITTITAPTGGGGESQTALCGPGPISAQPAGHTSSLSCCSCHSFN